MQFEEIGPQYSWGVVVSVWYGVSCTGSCVVMYGNL